MTEAAAGVLVEAAGRLHHTVKACELTDDDSHWSFLHLLASACCRSLAAQTHGIPAAVRVANVRSSDWPVSRVVVTTTAPKTSAPAAIGLSPRNGDGGSVGRRLG